jgi:hypothetical protein
MSITVAPIRNPMPRVCGEGLGRTREPPCYRVLWQSTAIKIAGTPKATTRELAPSYDEHLANRDVVDTLRLALEAAEG